MSEDKAQTAVQRAQAANRRLVEKVDPGRALQDALARHDEHSEACRHGNDPETCKVCEDKRMLAQRGFRVGGERSHRSHVHCTFSPRPDCPMSDDKGGSR